MQLEDLLADRFTNPDPDSIAFEGPIGGKRVAVNTGGALSMIAATRAAFGLDRGDAPKRIGVLSNHQIETYISVFATCCSGATFVPLNPKFPLARLNQILELAQVDLVAFDDSTQLTLGELDTNAPSVNVTTIISGLPQDGGNSVVDAVRGAAINPDAIAYIMFTSGSTGTPKGVPVSYGNLTAYVKGVTELVKFPEGARCSQFFDLSFDLSIHDIFVTNAIGGTLIAPSSIDGLMPSGYISRERINVWFSVPLLGATLAKSKVKDDFHGLEKMLFCGEALPMEVVASCRQWLSADGEIWNLYGPTEATIAFTGANVTNSSRETGSASIGQAFGVNVTAMLESDGRVNSKPRLGDEGELLLGGPQVFAGYSTDVPSPFVDDGDVRYYRSGDLVRLEDDGIYFRGRADSQIKFRGYRIELAEIETAMRRALGLTTVAVVLVGEQSDARIIGYFIESETSGDPDPAALASLLPAYMIPSRFIGLGEMPVNANGKIDRKVLATMVGEP